MLFLLRWLSSRRPCGFCTPGRRAGLAGLRLSPSYRRGCGQRRAGRRRRAGAPRLGGRGRPAGAELPRLWLRPADASPSPTRCAGKATPARGLLRRRPRPGAADAAPGQLRGLGAGLCRALRRAPADHRAVPPGAQAWLRELEETARARPGLATAPATLAGVRQMLRALRGRDRGPAARPGAARRHGRVGAVLRPAGLHDDAGGAPGAADRRGRLACCGPSACPAAAATWCAQPLAQPLPRADGDEASARGHQRAMEAVIRQCPQQYLWGYHRYKKPRRRSFERRLSLGLHGPCWRWLWLLHWLPLGCRRPGPGLGAAAPLAAAGGASRCATSSCACPS
jgi:KDO2-lipid IV(A) lauroyltransferase